MLLLLANVASQMLTLLVSPIITRLYTPQDFGLLGVISSLIVIFAPICSGRFELAIPAEKTSEGAIAVATLSIAFAVLSSLVIALVALALAFTDFAFMQTLKAYWYFFPVCLAAFSIYNILGIEAGRCDQFGPLAASRFAQAGVGAAAQIGFGLGGLGTFGLLAGFLLNQSAGTFRLFRSLGGIGQYIPKPDWRKYWNIARVHRELLLFSSWTDALGIASRWAVQIAITIWWDPAVGGFMFLADRVVGRPLLVLSSSMLNVFYAQIGTMLREDDRRNVLPLFMKTIRRQAVVSVAWAAMAFVLAPLCIGPIFGPQWDGAVHYVQVMGIAILPGIILSPITHILKFLGQSRVEAYIVIGRVVATVACLWICYASGMNALLTLSIFAALQFVIGGITLLVYLSRLHEFARSQPIKEQPDHAVEAE